MLRISYIVLFSVECGQHCIYSICQCCICIHKSMTIVSEEICKCHSSESPFISENCLHKVAAFSSPFISKETPGNHNRICATLFHRNFKWFQIDFPDCLLVRPDTYHFGVAFIHSKMLDVRINSIVSCSFYCFCSHIS